MGTTSIKKSFLLNEGGYRDGKLLVGECSAFLASGSDPTDERRMKHGPQTTPRRSRRELAACMNALTERVIASRALTFHRVMH